MHYAFNRVRRDNCTQNVYFEVTHVRSGRSLGLEALKIKEIHKVILFLDVLSKVNWDLGEYDREKYQSLVSEARALMQIKYGEYKEDVKKNKH